MRADLGQIGELDGHLRSSIRHTPILLRFDEWRPIMRGCNSYTELVILSSRDKSRECRPASSVVSESIDVPVGDAKLAE